MTGNIEDLPYRLGVGILLVNRHGLVFTGKRIDSRGHEAWQMPQGGMDKGEEPRDTAHRELEEETGIPPHLTDIIGETADWLCYDLPADIQPRLWKGRYRGQKQKWFAMRFTGRDADVNVATRDPEFCDWRWVDPAQIAAQIIPFKRVLYAAVLAELLPLALSQVSTVSASETSNGSSSALSE